MAKKKKDDGGGVPEWVVTYGDMMSLLLCFFILLAAFSELKREHEYQRVVDSIKEAFGYQGGVGHVAVSDPPLRSVIEQLDKLSLDALDKTKISKSEDPGMDGDDLTVRKIEEGVMFTIGGHLTFDHESARLMESAKAPLREVADLLRGRTNYIAVRGHAASKHISPAFEFEDLEDLSYYRAKTVKHFLVSECGLNEDTLFIEARGDSIPIVPRRQTPEDKAVNRRVEIILTERLADDLHVDPNYSDPTFARGEVGP
jgi:chemotaxis protein MotB